MSWGLILLSYAAKQQQLFGLSDAMMVAIALQFIYLTKFYIWETGYLCSLDIMHDRAGFYICWGCLVWVPCIYTSPSMYLVLHPIHLGILLAATIFVLRCCQYSYKLFCRPTKTIDQDYSRKLQNLGPNSTYFSGHLYNGEG